MGLEAVELLMEIEESLGVSVPEDEIGSIETVGDLFDAIMRRKRDLSTDPPQLLLQQTFELLEAELRNEFGLLKPMVREDWLDVVIPRRGRRSKWHALSERLGLRLPTLERPRAVVIASVLCVAVAGSSIGYWTRHLDVVPRIVAIGLGLVTATISAALLTRPFATAFPTSIKTMGQLVETVAAYNYDELAARLGTSGPDGAWDAVRRLVAGVYGVAEQQVGRNTSFVTDL